MSNRPAKFQPASRPSGGGSSVYSEYIVVPCLVASEHMSNSPNLEGLIREGWRLIIRRAPQTKTKEMMIDNWYSDIDQMVRNVWKHVDKEGNLDA